MDDPRLAHREAIDLVLAAVAASEWADNLVLRGSVLLTAWFGAQAREPRDLDFVVTPVDWRLEDDAVQRMLMEIPARAAELSQAAGSLRIHPVPVDIAAAYHVWTYRGAPGRSVTLAWERSHGGTGDLRIDFAFGEELPAPAIRTPIPRLGTPGPPPLLSAASRPLALAWKLLWLAAEGKHAKDLYDAVLLAESCSVPTELLEKVLKTGDNEFYLPLYEPGRLIDLYRQAEWTDDWRDLATDRPELTKSFDDYVWRLIVAVAPSFPPGLTDLYARLANSYAWAIEDLRRDDAAASLEAVEQWFRELEPPAVEQFIVLRELLGRNTPPHEIADIITTMQTRYLPERPYPYFSSGYGDPHRIATDLGPYLP
ncbi:nucleotidyl transferase AbiEii/AbiGii toxin family protein [Nocardia yamanashiensis]|uniref:nucleotidyl transferase AbiEii/AbiGii toxin family protein n=1 Tax=Nocardia yamanashiensis TaxID=209247 RepID=UPI000AA42261|nr:nucleotidyl transferase AbiEii/AbiGii toxin family protein [Nocardia yamanashiensis]